MINIRTVRIETKNVMVYVYMAHVTEGACQKGEEGVDTLQAAEPPCSVSNAPVKINLKTSVSGGLIYKIGPSGAQYYFCFNLYFFKTKNH